MPTWELFEIDMVMQNTPPGNLPYQRYGGRKKTIQPLLKECKTDRKTTSCDRELNGLLKSWKILNMFSFTYKVLGYMTVRISKTPSEKSWLTFFFCNIKNSAEFSDREHVQSNRNKPKQRHAWRLVSKKTVKTEDTTVSSRWFVLLW